MLPERYQRVGTCNHGRNGSLMMLRASDGTLPGRMHCLISSEIRLSFEEPRMSVDLFHQVFEGHFLGIELHFHAVL